MTAERLRGTVGVLLTGAGVAAALTLVFLSMRAVLDVGGYCASGGPYEIATPCPKHVAGTLILSIWVGLVLVGLYVWQAARAHAPSLVALLWPALFLSLGSNFLEYGVRGGGVVGWLICGVLFVLMGGVPLALALPDLWRHLVQGHDPPPSFGGGAARAVVSRVRQRAGGADLADQLERLDELHRSGALDDLEYANAKDRVIRGKPA